MKSVWNFIVVIIAIIAQLTWFGALIEFGIGWLLIALFVWPIAFWPIILSAVIWAE